MSLDEYLYVDQKRLDSYFEQISSPVSYDKIPTWKFSLGVTGPSVEGGQERRGRQFTTFEKIKSLMVYLEKKGIVDTFRPSHKERWHTKQIFRLEICRAIRVFIPPKPNISSSFTGLGLWISYVPHPKHRRLRQGRPTGALYLLEDFQQADSNTPYSRSSYSTLFLLLSQFKEIENTIVSDGLKEQWFTNQLGFTTKPDQFLRALGAKVSPSRLIKCLYRIRATINDDDDDSHERFPVVTVGYPIFIAEADSELL